MPTRPPRAARRSARLVVPLAVATTVVPAAPAAAVLRGTTAPIAAHPALAQIQVGQRTICTGTLVAPRVVLTAAHCIGLGETPDHVVLGRQTTRDRGTGQRLRVRRHAVHPDWLVGEDGRGPTTVLNADIALLELEARPAGAAPLPLIAPADAPLLAPNRPATVIGWGYNRFADIGRTTIERDLHAGPAPIRSAAYCRSFAARLAGGFSDNETDFVLAPDALCVGAVRGIATTACKGDSGGPLLVQGPNGPLVAGVSSFGTPRCTGNVAGYARLLDSPARRWLDRHLVGDRLVRHPTAARRSAAAARIAAPLTGRG